MTVAELYEEIHFQTKSNSTIFPDADKLRGLNLDQQVAFMLMMRAKGFKKVSETVYTTDFVANAAAGESGYQGEYSFDSTMIKVNQVKVTYPGRDPQVCIKYDETEPGTPSETHPGVTFARDSLIITPAPSVTVPDGIELLVEKRFTALTETTHTPILDPLFHNFYVLGQALRFGKFRDGVSRADIVFERQKVEQDIMEFYKKRDSFIKQLNPVFPNYK